MNYWIVNYLYAPLILHFAAGLGERYRSVTHSDSRAHRDIYAKSQYLELSVEGCRRWMLSVKNERYDGYKNSARATDFMVVISLFKSNKLVALRNAYQYYLAFYKGDINAVEKKRATIDPAVLLWLVAILGRYDIFCSIKTICHI